MSNIGHDNAGAGARRKNMIMTDQNAPSPCDQEVFAKGISLLAADTDDCGADGFEEWVQAISRKSGQRADWHYSGRVAQVLYIGDRQKPMEAIEAIPCPGRIMRYLGVESGLYRAGMTPVLDGTISGFWDGGSNGSTFIGEGKPIQPGDQVRNVNTHQIETVQDVSPNGNILLVGYAKYKPAEMYETKGNGT